jgi:AcrR family transcriptional regulator
MVTDSSPSRGERRRADILKVALALFNARDTQSVSTNHIAAELGISVGNLYWHFRDKEAIVRELYAENRRKFDGVWARPQTSGSAIDLVVLALRRAFAITWDYRFLYRELAPLTRADPELRKLHAACREQRRGELLAFQRSLVELGVFQFPDGDASLARLDDLGWMIALFWLPHVDLRDGTLTKRAVLQGARAVLALYLPYVAREHAQAFAAALDRASEET